jgi:hypothetical protein
MCHNGNHAGIVGTLCDIIVAHHKAASTAAVVAAHKVDQDNSIRTILPLVNEDKNHKLMCNRAVLRALVVSADAVDTRGAAIRALEPLATETSQPGRHGPSIRFPGLRR